MARAQSRMRDTLPITITFTINNISSTQKHKQINRIIWKYMQAHSQVSYQSRYISRITMTIKVVNTNPTTSNNTTSTLVFCAGRKKLRQSRAGRQPNIALSFVLHHTDLLPT